ncbi:MAG: hypothetical protein K0S33_3825 [Bacteroidetes bacterium]|jgi:hypothetical protein|nr:hypothetical protein [Bacteroidota bacterium]
MSWGKKITILYIGFVLLISSLVYISATNKSELVAKDYYAQELSYQDRIDAIANEKGLEETISFELLPYSIVLTYPGSGTAKDLQGEILFFRPSDASKDRKIKMDFNVNNVQVIHKQLLSKGVYRMSISWKKGDRSYYKEEIITI